MSQSSLVHLTTLFPRRLLGHLGYLKLNNFCLFIWFEVLCPMYQPWSCVDGQFA